MSTVVRDEVGTGAACGRPVRAASTPHAGGPSHALVVAAHLTHPQIAPDPTAFP